MLDVHRLRLLREVQRRGTLSAVARALSYTPSAISQQLAQLEAETGVALLERVGRGVRLTPQGEVLVAHTDAVMERLELAEAELAAAQNEAVGRLRVATFGSVLLELVPAALTSLAGEHPRLQVVVTQMEPEPAVTGLLAHDFDIVMGEEYPSLPPARVAEVDEEDLLHDEIHLVVPTTGPLAGLGAQVQDYIHAPWVLDPPSIASGQWERAVCRSAGFEPDVRFTTPDPLMHLHLVETGHAVGLVPHLATAGRHHDVRLLPLPDRPARRLFSAVRRGAATHPAVRALREGLRRGLAQFDARSARPVR